MQFEATFGGVFSLRESVRFPLVGVTVGEREGPSTASRGRFFIMCAVLKLSPSGWSNEQSVPINEQTDRVPAESPNSNPKRGASFFGTLETLSYTFVYPKLYTHTVLTLWKT